MKRLTVKQMCTLAMLVAVTVVLSYVSGHLRIGNSVKFSLSFISVYVSGALFGPFWGGFVGAAADIVSHFVNPVGAYIWQFTLIELVYGASYGIFFYRGAGKKQRRLWPAVTACALGQGLISLFYKTYVLTELGFMPSIYEVNVYARLLPVIVMAAFKLAAIYLIEKKYINMFRSMLD